ncbi:MAG TPA: hypothetical protein VJR67_03185 [Candidatus Nitrosopolaris sp.]|jgi:hypothetical protein|nr:hypothetical protein [Candidatus Nitrosopolaris sp.]
MNGLNFWPSIAVTLSYAAILVNNMKNLSDSEIEEIKKLHHLRKRSSWIAHKYGVRKKQLQVFFEDVTK